MNAFATVIVSPNPPDPAAPFLGTCHLGIVVHGESIADTLRRLADAIDDHEAGLDAEAEEAEAHLLALERDGHFSPTKAFGA